MSQERHARVSEIFAKAIELSVEARPAFLDQACGADEQLRAELDELLARDAEPAVVDAPLLDEALCDRVVGAVSGTDDLPGAIGGYDIIGVLGRGGMGTVYRVRQARTNRTVALKFVQHGFASRSLARRLEYEAHVLGRLQHNGIAQIYEAGTADVDGRPLPYFAMELVEGSKLTDYANAQNLGTRARLALLMRICEAVHHAHQQGVIHRDLKPANILVNAAGEPKVLDFGVARVTDTDVKTTTLRTNVGQLIGTIAYMSPEQIAGSPDEVDVRSDVYALGVLAYELLAGQLPYDLQDRSIPEAAQIIRDVEPARLSTLSRTLRGDLETIVAKALEKDKTQRYASVNGLRADIERFLCDEPIVARPRSLAYQVHKFARRNKALVGGAVSTVLLLCIAVAGTSYGLVSATRERDDAIAAREQLREARDAARVEADKAIAVNRFLNRMLSSANPLGDVAYGARDITVLEMLDREVESLGSVFTNQPEVEAAVRMTVGLTYKALGRATEAEHHLRMALELDRALSGDESSDTARAQRELAGALVLLGKTTDAIGLLRAAQRTEQALGGTGSLDYATTEVRLGWALMRQAEYAEAEQHLRSALQKLKAYSDPESDLVPSALNNLARVLRARGANEDAEKLYRKANEAFRSLYGDTHASVGITENNIAYLAQLRGDLAEAEARYGRAGEVLGAVLGREHPTVATIISNQASVLYDRSDYERSVERYRVALDIYRGIYGESHAEYISTLNNLAFALYETGDYPAAADAFATVGSYHRTQSGEDDWHTLLADLHWGESIARLGDVAEAERVMLRAHARLLQGSEHSLTVKRAALRALIRMYTHANRPQEAARYEALLAEAEPDGM